VPGTDRPSGLFARATFANSLDVPRRPMRSARPRYGSELDAAATSSAVEVVAGARGDVEVGLVGLSLDESGEVTA